MKFGDTAKSHRKDRYYHLWIAAAKDQVFFQTSIDKAYVISLFHLYLSPRRRDQPRYCEELDLIAYSLTDFGMNLLLCATGTKIVEDFGQNILVHYSDFLHQQSAWEVLPFDTIFTYDKLADEHEALAVSREIHLLHDDWRHDRYSSIGFYLDDRRGDWLHPWRLTDLYHNDTHWYQHFLTDEDRIESPLQFEFLET